MVHWRVLSSMWSFHKAGVIFSLQTLGTSKALMRTVNHWGICNNCNKSCCPLAIKHTSGNACFFKRNCNKSIQKMVDFQIRHVSLLDCRCNDKTWLVLEVFYSAEVPNVQSHSYGFSEPNTSATNGWTVRWTKVSSGVEFLVPCV